MKRHVIKQSPNAAHNPFVPQRQGTYAVEENSMEAVVVDVIINSKHPQYASDGYNVGAIQYKTIKTDFYRDSSTLNWALPLESNISDYPLLNEHVIVFPSLNRMYYTRKLNTSNRVTVQALYGVNEELVSTEASTTQLSTLQKSTANPQVVSTEPQSQLGAYFQDNQKIYRLEHDEGDIIFEGRTGQSIRLGAAFLGGNTHFQASQTDESPNILMRVGQNPSATPTVNTIYGLITEDINQDASSFWMVSDQIVNLTLATPKGSSIKDYPAKLSGNQVFINTDRLIFNAKQDKVMGFANNGIHWTSGADFTVDTINDYISDIQGDSTIKIEGDSTLEVDGDRTETIKGDDSNTTQGNSSLSVQGNTSLTTQGTTAIDSTGHIDIKSSDTTSILGTQVFIATENSTSQPIPCGQLLANFLDTLIRSLLTFNGGGGPFGFAASPTGPLPVTLSPGLVTNLITLRNQVQGGPAVFNSTTAFVSE